MSEVMAGFIGKFVQVYLDDVIIYSRNREEHTNHLRLVLERLRIHGLICTLEKCVFEATSLEYLGFKITATHNEVLDKDIEKIRNFPTLPV